MTTALLPDDEAERLKVLAECAILDTPPEQAYDDLTQLAAYVCGAPMALVSLIDANRQWFKSRIGVHHSQTNREISFCAHTILRPDPLIIADTLHDPRFLGSALVIGEPFIRFYAGVPLRSREGHPLGTLCVLDKRPRQLQPEQLEGLKALARLAALLLELRRVLPTLHDTLATINEQP
jgi:GAF domain-containing protein